MSQDSVKMVKNILKEQNRRLLEQIADKFGLDPDLLKQKYMTPTFYCVEVKNIKQ